MTFNDIISLLCNSRLDNYQDLIQPLFEKYLLYEQELSILEKYVSISNQLGKPPELSTFVSQCQEYVQPQEQKYSANIKDDITLFIKARKNQQASRKLMEVASNISRDGITSDSMDVINSLLKSDSVETESRNILNNIFDIYNAHPDDSGIKTGIGVIDKVIGSLEPGQVSVIAGYTGAGKSQFSVSVSHKALEDGFNVLYLSLELSAEHLGYNFISRHSCDKKFKKKIEHRDLKKKNLKPEDVEAAKEIHKDLLELPGNLYITDEQDIGNYSEYSFLKLMEQKDREAIKDTGHGIDLVIVDHIQMLKYGTNDRMSEGSTINKYVDFFRSNALDWLKSKRMVHVMLVCQCNRTGWQRAVRNNGMYTLTALSEASELERAAAVVISIFSDPSLIASKEVKLALLKTRDSQRSEEPEVCYADFAYQLIGDEGVTSDVSFADATLDDVFGAQDLDFSTDSLDIGDNVDLGSLDDFNF